MPIVNCGHPPNTLVAGPDNKPRLVTGRDMLVLRGPGTPVEIGFNADLFDSDPAKVKQAVIDTHKKPTQQLVNALIDTGAQESAIDEELAKQLGLPLVDEANGSGIGGTEKFNVYLGHIRIVALNYLQYGRFMGVKLAAAKDSPYKAIIGRTVLQGTLLVYDGRDGTVRLAL